MGLLSSFSHNFNIWIFPSLLNLQSFLQVLSFGRSYFLDRWNQFDMLIILLSIVDIVLDVGISDEGGSSGVTGIQLLKIAKIFRLLRVSRVFRLFKVKKG